MFIKIRKNNPDLPIVLMNRPKFILNNEQTERYKIIEATYNNAVLSGDKNVYFVDNKELTELCKEDGTVDNCHPTDLGFLAMAQGLYNTIKDENIEK